MRLVFAGTPEVAVPSLTALAASRHEVVAVLTRPDAPAGRGRAPARSAVARWADDAGVPVLQPARPAEPQFVARLAEVAPECCPVVAYGALLPAATLAVPRHGWVNLHFSLLPAWRGAAPVQHAVMAGDELTGASTFRLEPGLDTGPVYGVMTDQIRPRDTAGDLLARLAEGGAQLLVQTLDAIEAGAADPRAQPADGVTLAPKISADDARVTWSLPAVVVDRRVRGCTPDPGAWTTWRGQRLGLGPVHPASAGDHQQVPEQHLPPGQHLEAGQLQVGKRAVLVGTGHGSVTLGEVRPAGRRAMPATDWARGVRPEAGECFA